MRYPAFFDEVPPIVLHDGLGEFLGAFERGILEIRYADVVRMAGHSCPTVAGAWLMTRAALDALWPDGPAERGGVRVELRAPLGEGNAGVVGAVIANVTGAAYGDAGFSGIAGRWRRRDLLRFGSPVGADVRFTRLETGAAVEVAYHPERLVDPGPLLREALRPDAPPEARERFAERWQAMVRTILENAAAVVDVTTVTGTGQR